jgi:hypothetical protein
MTRKKSIDSLPGIALAISNAGNIFTNDDIKSLRLTCKLLKELADPFLTKLKVDIHELALDDDYAALASSSLLDHTRELEIWSDEIDLTEFWDSNGQYVLSIVQQCAPHIELLSLSLCDEDDLVLQKLSSLSQNLKYPSLKSLDIQNVLPDTVSILSSMPSLLILSLGTGGNNLDIDDVKILSRAPVLKNLTDVDLGFELKFDHNTGELSTAENAKFIEPLISLFKQVLKMERLRLYHAPTLQFFEDAPPLENLQRVYIENCNFAGNFSLPQSLIDLHFNGCSLNQKAIKALLTSGCLPRLKILDFDGVAIMDDIDGNFWTKCLPKLNLPLIESISIKTCQNCDANAALCIAEAAPKLLNLKKYVVCLVKGWNNSVSDVSLVKKFFSSPLCANIEVLELQEMDLGAAGFKVFIENASNMQCLKILEGLAVDRVVPQLKLMAKAGSHGGWPLLESLVFTGIDGACDGPRDSLYANEKVFARVWPNLKLSFVIGYGEYE